MTICENAQDKVVCQIYSHAQQEFPNECCGFVRDAGGGLEVIPVPNSHHLPRTGFRVAPELFAVYSRQSLFMYHSHPNGECLPSEADMDVYDRTLLPQMVVSWPHGNLSVYGDFDLPLLGRPFVYGALDCYGLVRSYYAQVLGIDLPNYMRPRYGWWEKGLEDPFVNTYPQAGFRKLKKKEKIQPHDLVMLRLAGSQKINHIGVITSEYRLLHHRLNSYSCRVAYDGYYQENTAAVLRYDS